MTPRFALVTAALMMALAVALGAFGAHALRARIAPELVAVWQTGVTYHAWHAIALLVVGVLRMHATDRRAWRIAGALFVAGVVLFSGSLYALALGAPAWFGLVTPFGGVAFIGGWLCVSLGALAVSEV